MPNTKKTTETKYFPVITGMTKSMSALLDTAASNNKTSRNDIVRRACEFLLKNKKKFSLK
jgi:hypothetical protein